MASHAPEQVELIAIARIVRPRGLKGELVAELLTDFPERFDALSEVTAVFPDTARRGLTLEDHWFQKGRVVLKFKGVDSIEAGEELRGAEICVPESDAVELDEGEFYDWQLEGCTVKTVDGSEIGKVRELMRTAGTELLVVDSEVRELLIPFVEAICVDVDIDARTITIDPPEGLLDL